MIWTILGLFLLLAPFSLIFLFSDKKKGFLYLLFFILIFHTFLAFFTQYLRWFYYPVLISINLVAVLFLIIFFFFSLKKKKGGISDIPQVDFDLVLGIIILISFLTLYQVHFNYTGKINFATDDKPVYHEVKNFKYPYPYFSDEWYAISLINYSIKNNALPLYDPINNEFFLNLEMFFHSLLSEFFLILKLTPLIHYTFLSLIFNTLIIVLIYLFLRLNNVSQLSSAIISLSVLYITCGANLPGIWHFIPVHLGIIFCLLGLCFLAMNNFWLALLVSFFVIIFYGPLFIFYGLSLFIFGLLKFCKNNLQIIKTTLYILIGLFLILPPVTLLLIISPWSAEIKNLFSRFFYVSLTGIYNPQIIFYKIVPFLIIPFTIGGTIKVFQTRKWLLFPFILGLSYWIFYSFSFYRAIIEYERVVFFTSLLSIIIAGFGLEWFIEWLKKKIANLKNFNINFLIKISEFGLITLFLLLVPFYTQREKWKSIVLINTITKEVFYPKAPANQYLTEDDLKIFKNIKEKRFLSFPWKGTVIAVATDNYPVVAKEGNLSTGDPKIIDQFLKADCQEKLKMAKRLKIDYIYLFEFNCPSFEEKARSKENLVLYRVK